ncbi:uncharacterized protein [Nicotiana tomentosiformis]|uniref:uncharacterized protein n=1 Tax=Nicotiana tomentosiformis TaxID=4098 RepID=UPI00388C3866
MVYGFNDAALRRKLWEDIKEIHEHMDELWAVMGDFNCVLHKEERIGSPITMTEIREFKQCVKECTLQDMKNEGTLDHCPAIIRWAVDQKKQHMFRYFNMWSMAPDYKETVKQGWKTNKTGTKIYELVEKLNNLKGKLRQLNKEKFSHIEKKADQTQEILMQCQQRMQQIPLNQELQEEEARLTRKTKRLNEARHQYLKQKRKVQWLEKGDLNTKLFHNMMKARRNMNKIFSITDAQGVNRTEVDAIAKSFIDFYTTC